MNRSILVFIAALLLAGCGWFGAHSGGDDTIRVERGESFWLLVGQTAETPDGATLTFEKLIADSRCPADVECIWGGVARVSVVPSEPRVPYQVPATLTIGDLRPPDHQQIGPFRLLDVHPYPRTDGRSGIEIPRAQFVIE